MTGKLWPGRGRPRALCRSQTFAAIDIHHCDIVETAIESWRFKNRACSSTKVPR
jgi:hypothetical protein